MLVLSIGIMAIVAGFSAGFLAVDRASRTSTAGTLADKQMEAYRALPFSQAGPPALGIALKAGLGAAQDAAYTAGLAGDLQSGDYNLLTGTGQVFLPGTPEATYCDTFKSHSCLVQGCSLTPNNCFSGWECCDLSAFGVPQPICVAQGACSK